MKKKNNMVFLIYLGLLFIGMSLSYLGGYYNSDQEWLPVLEHSRNLSVSSFNGCNSLFNMSLNLYKHNLEEKNFILCQDKCLYESHAIDYEMCYWKCKA